MLSEKEFIEKIKKENKPLFDASRMNVRAYFESKPSKEDLIKHFVGRMVNERMNMVEISKQVANMAVTTDPFELQQLSRQAFDEAVHFRLVKEVIEKIKGSKIDIEEAIKSEELKPTAKGATLLEKYDAQNDEVALATYQLIAEGRAEAVWYEMADCIEDEYISSRYAKIAEDEGFHASIGEEKLKKLVTSKDVQEKVLKLAEKMRKDLFDISCKNTSVSPQTLNIVSSAYGWTF